MVNMVWGGGGEFEKGRVNKDRGRVIMNRCVSTVLVTILGEVFSVAFCKLINNE